MATSVYFNNYSAASTSEQRLFEDMIVESIKMMGHDVKYLPREAFDKNDDVLGENPTAKFSKAYNIEMYLANVEGYEGDGDFFSKFGLELRESSNFIVSRRSFEKYVPSTIAIRPREGDLIYVPVLQKIFEIKFVENELMFKSLGNTNAYVYELRAEMFRYSNENIETGDEEVDEIELENSYTVRVQVAPGTENYYNGEMVYQGSSFASSLISARVKGWNPDTRILEVINMKGSFIVGDPLIGVDSQTAVNVVIKDEMEDLVHYDDSDNRVIQTEADAFVDLSEINPFGVP